MSQSWTQEGALLRQGGVIIYPTETFYALGCLGTRHEAAKRIVTIKARPATKPLPLIISDWSMAEAFLCMDAATTAVARKFWPGPLSVITATHPDISPLTQDDSGRCAVRMTPHPIAAALCQVAGAPLVSTSANLSGQKPVCRPDDLDPALLCATTIHVVSNEPWPTGGLPSTLLEVLTTGIVRVLREGVISTTLLRTCGLEVL